jgi:hypothetical protein
MASTMLDVHRDFEAETKLDELRFGPHGAVSSCGALSNSRP